ncbi:MAG: nucleotide sugar dehydrogenase, partial [Dehalococcoidia bacterium]|nr:nucleotide sugar dehydrogenase [Dehalococcoidia bacterium]
MALLQRIADRTARVGVIGLGYVGLPLVVALLKAGFRVVGVDTSAAKAQALQAGESYIPDVPAETVRRFVTGPAAPFTVSTDYQALADCDVVFICVPTPFDAHKTPDLSFIERASTSLAAVLRAGQLVILQSTTYPGTTEEVVRPILERTGLRAGEDFLLAFSPERVDPGNTTWTVENTPKVVGGLTARCAEAAVAVLAAVTPDVHVVSSPRVAEATKLLENVFRSVNIALVNEMALLAERMGFDVWEVIRAASTKPFGFMPFYPGPGVGGHCIPVDPFYLAWKAREYDFSTRFIELAAETNEAMPHHVVGLIVRALGAAGKSILGAKTLLLGVGFKPDVTDTRNSPAERLVQLLV